MSGTQPTMADAHPPGAQVFKLPVDPPRPGIECPANLLYGGDPPPSERQYPIKLDKDGVLRYRPEEGDFKRKSPIVASASLYQSPIKRQAPDEWPEDEDKSEDEAKLTGPSRKKAKKDKAAKKEKDKGDDTWAKRKKAKQEKAKAKANARSLSSHKGDIDENSSVAEVGKWVLHMKGLGWCGLDCSQIFEEHNIDGSDVLQMTEETIKKLGLDTDDREIILNHIKTLQAKCPKCKQPITIKGTQGKFGCPNCKGIFNASTKACIGELFTNADTGVFEARLFPDPELAKADKKDKAEDDLDVWDNMLRLYTGEEVKQKGLETRCFKDAWGHAHYCLKKDWKYWSEPTDGRKPVILDALAFPKPPPGSKEPPYPTPFQVYYLNTKTYALVRGEY